MPSMIRKPNKYSAQKVKMVYTEVQNALFPMNP